MEETRKKGNKAYRIFCACICLLAWMLSYFKGHVYISSNGYAVLKCETVNPIDLDDEGSAKYLIGHEIIINGDYFYLTYCAGEEYMWEIPEGALRFHSTIGDYGFSDFYVVREDGRFRYKIYESRDIYSYELRNPETEGYKSYKTYQKEMDMLVGFITANWANFCIFGHVLMDGGHTMTMHFSLGLILLLRYSCQHLIKSRMQGGKKRDMLHQRICCYVFGFFQMAFLMVAALQYVTFLAR